MLFLPSLVLVPVKYSLYMYCYSEYWDMYIWHSNISEEFNLENLVLFLLVPVCPLGQTSATINSPVQFCISLFSEVFCIPAFSFYVCSFGQKCINNTKQCQIQQVIWGHILCASFVILKIFPKYSLYRNNFFFFPFRKSFVEEYNTNWISSCLYFQASGENPVR